MDKESIIKIVTSYIKQSQSGLEIENPKCDFKRIWYDLTEPKDISEFLKDTSAIANTFGLDGYIIIGFDPKTKTFHNSIISDCKLKDPSYILDLINKKVDQLFEINTYDIIVENNSLSVIHIPPSIDKPHVIRNHQVFDKEGKHKNEVQRIFIRKNCSNFSASKYDIELMFYDKKNIIPEYKIETYLHYTSIEFHFKYKNNEEYGIEMTIKLNIENLGRRPIAINKIQFSSWLTQNPSEFEIVNFESIYEYKSSPIIIPTGHFYSSNIELESIGMNQYGADNIRSLMFEFRNNRKHLTFSPITLHLANGSRITIPFTLNIL